MIEAHSRNMESKTPSAVLEDVTKSITKFLLVIRKMCPNPGGKRKEYLFMARVQLQEGTLHRFYKTFQHAPLSWC